jgi:choline dehydrogenase-like flavoprotein
VSGPRSVAAADTNGDWPPILQWFLTKKGLAASSHLESGGFARSGPEVEHADLQFHFLPSTVHNDGRVDPSCHAYQVGAMSKQFQWFLLKEVPSEGISFGSDISFGRGPISF